MTVRYEHLVGRKFTGLGKQDCLDLTRHFFRDNFDIEIPNFARPNDWKSDELDLIGSLGPVANFQRIEEWKPAELRPADLLCIAIGEAKPNHLAIYLGEDRILHHLYGRMSDVAPFRDIWRTRTAYIYRHSEVPDLRPVYPDVSLEDLINARNDAQLG